MKNAYEATAITISRTARTTRENMLRNKVLNFTVEKIENFAEPLEEACFLSE
jgi:hypothetical protein